MSTEPQPKRDSLTGWFLGVGALLLLAAAAPVALKLYGPREMVMDLQGDPGGQIIWRMEAGGRVQSGVTNVPVKLVFHARQMEFTAHRTNYTGPLQLNVVVGGASRGSVSMGGSTGGVRFKHNLNSWSVSGTK
jgi:hypothetical protein